jgi:hypothetical protein
MAVIKHKRRHRTGGLPNHIPPESSEDSLTKLITSTQHLVEVHDTGSKRLGVLKEAPPSATPSCGMESQNVALVGIIDHLQLWSRCRAPGNKHTLRQTPEIFDPTRA